MILEGIYMKKDFRVWIFKARENGKTVMVGSSEREGLMSVYPLDRKRRANN